MATKKYTDKDPTIYSFEGDTTQGILNHKTPYNKKLKGDFLGGSIGAIAVTFKTVDPPQTVKRIRLYDDEFNPNPNMICNADELGNGRYFKNIKKLKFAGLLALDRETSTFETGALTSFYLHGTHSLQVDYETAVKEKWYNGCRLFCTLQASNMRYDYGKNTDLVPFGLSMIERDLSNQLRQERRERTLRSYTADVPRPLCVEAVDAILTRLGELEYSDPTKAAEATNRLTILRTTLLNPAGGAAVLNLNPLTLLLGTSMTRDASTMKFDDIKTYVHFGLLFFFYNTYISDRTDAPEFLSVLLQAKTSQFYVKTFGAVASTDDEKQEIVDAYYAWIQSDPTLLSLTRCPAKEEPHLKVRTMRFDDNRRIATIRADIIV